MGMVDWRSTSPEIAGSGARVAVINIGSVEQHGAHLPVGTDTIIGEHIARKVAEALGAYLLPSFAVGNCQEHMGRAGTVWIKPQTMFAVVTDVCLSLKEQGFSRIVIIPTHGGLWILKPAVREINLNHPDLVVLLVPDFSTGSGEEVLTGEGMDLHAGEVETSMMLHIDPGAVKMELAVDAHPAAGREYLDYAAMAQISPSGVWGAATHGTAAKGKVLLERRVASIVAYCNETFAAVDRLRQLD